VAQHVENIMQATPSSLSGHDQDWDDAIYRAHSEAKDLFCVRIEKEYICTPEWGSDNCYPTGKIREYQKILVSE
jgi:hypothetical protein